MQDEKTQTETDASRRELLAKLGKAAYIAPVTIALLSSEKAAAY
jgi:hypothetical protein